MSELVEWVYWSLDSKLVARGEPKNARLLEVWKIFGALPPKKMTARRNSKKILARRYFLLSGAGGLVIWSTRSHLLVAFFMCSSVTILNFLSGKMLLLQTVNFREVLKRWKKYAKVIEKLNFLYENVVTIGKWWSNVFIMWELLWDCLLLYDIFLSFIK